MYLNEKCNKNNLISVYIILYFPPFRNSRVMKEYIFLDQTVYDFSGIFTVQSSLKTAGIRVRMESSSKNVE